MANSIIKKTSSQYPKVYHGRGRLISGYNLAIAGYGSATLTLFETGIAKIDFVQTITIADSSASNFNWGIDKGMFNTFFGVTLPEITPANAYDGVATYYNSSGNLLLSAVENGGTFERHNGYWTPARTFETNRIGGWPPSMFPVGSKIVGTCYGTFTV